MYQGSTQGLSQLLLIGHLLQHLCVGEARQHGDYRLERVLYNPVFRSNSGADVVVLMHYDDNEAAWIYVWQVRTRLLYAPGPLTTAARALLKLGFDPVLALHEHALHDPLNQPVPSLLKVITAVEEVE